MIALVAGTPSIPDMPSGPQVAQAPAPIPAKPAEVPVGKPLDYSDVARLFVGDTTVIRTGRTSNYRRLVSFHGLGDQTQSRKALKFDSVVNARVGVDALSTGPRQSDSVWALLAAPTSGVVALELQRRTGVVAHEVRGPGVGIVPRATNGNGHVDDKHKVADLDYGWDGRSNAHHFDVSDPTLRIKSERADLLEVLTPYFTLVPDANGVLSPAPEGS